MPTETNDTIHRGRNVKRFREMLGIKKETLVPTRLHKILGKLKRIYLFVTNTINRIGNAITPGKTTFNWAAVFVLFISGFTFITWHFDIFNSIGSFYAILYSCGFIILGALVAVFLSYVIKLCASIPPVYRVSVLFTLFMVTCVFYLDKSYAKFLITVLIVFPSLLGGGISILKRHNWRILRNTQSFIAFLAVTTGVAGLITFAMWMRDPGQRVNSTTNAKLTGAQPPLLQANDPSSTGKNQVQFLTYGSGKDKYRPEYNKGVSIVTPAVDGSKFLKSWTGFTGNLRTKYFGFDNRALPLNARVWYPKENGTFPLVIIVHGNHLAQDYSDAGYDYLGKLLASRGYIVASIDENFLNGSFTDLFIKNLIEAGLYDDNAVRSWLLLKHLQLWRNWNIDPSSPFYNRVDMNHIALLGHSRGGEAVINAVLFNKLPCLPEDANEVFDFNFNIVSVIAIAPSDGEYQPATVVPVKDINYFVMQGNHDIQSQSYQGLKPFYRIKFSPGFDGFKAGLYINNANHGQFNSSWGRRDKPTPYINKYNLEQLMSGEDQRKIAKVYISAFLDVTLKGNIAYKPLFMDYRVGRNWLPDEIYFNHFQSSGNIALATYDEDLDLTTTTIAGGHIEGNNLKIWSEQPNNLLQDDHRIRCVMLGWSYAETDTSTASYTITLPDTIPGEIKNKLLAFSLSDGGKDQKPIDFSIHLIDKQGHKVSFLLSSFSYLQQQIKKNMTKFPFQNQFPGAESLFDFFYFDIGKLIPTDSNFKVEELKKIQLVFDQSREGTIFLDDIGFDKAN